VRNLEINGDVCWIVRQTEAVDLAIEAVRNPDMEEILGPEETRPAMMEAR